MAELDFPLLVVLRKLEGKLLFGEVLFVPEISTLDDGRELVVGVLRRLSNEFLEGRPFWDLWRRRAPPAVTMEPLALELPQPRRQVAWLKPVILELPLVRWQQTP